MNKIPCFLAELPKQNLLHLNMSKKKNENFEKTSLISVKNNFMVCSTLVDMSYLSYTKKKFQEVKVQKFSLFWAKSFRTTHEYENQKTNSAFVIYWRTFTENINNSRKEFSQKTSQPGTCKFRVEEFYRSYSRPPNCDRIF